jgi:hypothetical protein
MAKVFEFYVPKNFSETVEMGPCDATDVSPFPTLPCEIAHLSRMQSSS